MSQYISESFEPIHDGWTIRALNPQQVPDSLRDVLTTGIPAKIPGEATGILWDAGLIDDPYDGDNERRQQWIGDVDWSFETIFHWTADDHTRHDLVAYGLDTVTTILLNGRPVGNAENFHRTYRWDVNGMLREGDNTLTLLFAAPVRETDRREQINGYYPHGEHHAFNQLRKPSSTFGWDWGIDIANAGIWRPIGLHAWTGARIRAVRPLVDVTEDGTGTLTTTVEIERESLPRIPKPLEHAHYVAEHVDDDAVPVTVSVCGHGVSREVSTKIIFGENRVVIKQCVPDVQLWWPVGYGSQPLYEVLVTIGSSDDLLYDEWRSRVGFRTVQVNTEADDIGRPFQLIINGVPVHARGYNWIPDDAMISRIDEQRYSRAVRDLVESNSNMVRVWGGGYYESDIFYDMLDENGIMVWQDFAFACAAYPEDADTKAQIEHEANEQISRLSSHPSLVIWNGSNENYMGYADWDGYQQTLTDSTYPRNRYGNREKGWGDYYYSKLIPELLDSLDPTRVYLPSSPMSFSDYMSPNLDTDGTVHIWDVWNSADYRKYADYVPRFADEFGYQAPPAWSTLASCVHDVPLKPFGDQMLVHQKADRGNLKMTKGMRSHLTPGKFDDISWDEHGNRLWTIPTDEWDDIEDWHWACQLQQAQAIRFGVNCMRALEPVNAGTLIWQLNDDWPVVSWAAVDYRGQRKPLWYASREFFSPRYAIIRPLSSQQARHDRSWYGSRVPCDTMALTVLNDTLSVWDGTWIVRRCSLDGEVYDEERFDVHVSANSQYTLTLPNDLFRFGDRSREILVASADHGFARTIYDPVDIIEQKLDSDPFDSFLAETADGYMITVTARSYVRDLFCMADKVCPTVSVDNGMVSLLPGESVVLHIRMPHCDDPDELLDPKVLRCGNDLKQ